MQDRPFPRIAGYCFIALAWLFAVSVTLQVFFAGLALFIDPNNWITHVSFARYFAFIPLIMTVLAWSASLPRKTIWRSLGLLGMIISMFLTAILSSRIGVLSALHPLIALMLFWSTMKIIRSFRQSIQ